RNHPPPTTRTAPLPLSPGQQTHAAPDSRSLSSFRFRQHREQTQYEWQSFELRCCLQHGIDLDGLPSIGLEKLQTFFRRKLERRTCLCHRITNFLLQHLEKAGRSKVRRPGLKRMLRCQVARETGNFLARKVDNQSFAENQGFPGPCS